MKRNIIKIDEEKCNGCGLCVSACHEGALKLIDGKAKLVSESYCDGLGNCLGPCPTGAITIEEREAAAFDEEAVKNVMNKSHSAAGGCPSSRAQTFERDNKVHDTLPCGCPSTHAKEFDRQEKTAEAAVQTENASELRQWPCQIKLVPVNAPYFNGAKLLIAADCTAYANANVHSRFMKGKITIIGCPKLDMVDYTEKLTDIIKYNDIKSVEVLRMSVPCCGGIENAVKQALVNSGKMIPWGVTVISTDGEILD